MIFVGFDPYRKHVRQTADYVFMAAALALVIALVVWALSA